MMITVVSGLPRSGTSMMMEMLKAGGMPILADDVRAADGHNIRGYFEYSRVKNLERDAAWLEQAEGKAVKIVSPLLFHLPANREYSIIMMLRPLPEICHSQAAMLEGMVERKTTHSARVLIEAFQRHLEKVEDWLKRQANIKLLTCKYHDILTDPASGAAEIAGFLDCNLDTARMRGVVDGGLCHYRETSLIYD